MDNELRVLNSVGVNAKLTQRDIALQTGLSLGTINILLKKMVREGFIKLESIPPKRLAYMLTPKGMEEKAKKVGSYIQAHYKAIQNMRIQLQTILEPVIAYDDVLILDIKQVELQSIVKQILQEKGKQYITRIEILSEITTTIIADYNRSDGLKPEIKWLNVMDELRVG